MENILKIERLALKYMNHHGLIDNGWRVSFDCSYHLKPAYRNNLSLILFWEIFCAGFCNEEEKIIGLSKYHLVKEKYEYILIKNVILHEIAHAIVGVECHHNDIWLQKFLEIGGHKSFGKKIVNNN
jgi:hypothetical protein